MTEPLITDPLITAPWARFFVTVIGLAITMSLSGRIVVGLLNPTEEQKKGGNIIGKCENIIAYVMVLIGEVTGLAIIFAAKSLVRGESAKASREDATYYIGGTLVNLVWSVGMALVVRTLIAGL